MTKKIFETNPGLQSITYYLPRSKKEPITASIVLLTDGKNISRGVAILSNGDSFNRKRGRSIAIGRALKAFYNRKTCKNNKIRRLEVGRKVPPVIQNKCTYMPELTAYEINLIDKLITYN